MLAIISNQVAATIRQACCDKFNITINIANLIVGLLVFLVIYLSLLYQFAADEWIPDNDRVYILESNKNIPGKPRRHIQSAPARIIPDLVRDMTSVEVTGMAFVGTINVHHKGEHYKAITHFVNDGFWSIFGLNPLQGSLAGFESEPNGIVLTEAESERLFGTAQSIGQLIHLSSGRSVTVKAVIDNWPRNSHLHPTSFMSLKSPEFSNADAYLNNWGSTGGILYLKFISSIDPDKLKPELANLLEKYAPANYGQSPGAGQQPFYQLMLRNVTEVRINSSGDSNVLGLPISSFGLLLMGVIILLICTINFSISASAQVTARQKEIIMRKLLGAEKFQLGLQFIVESALVCSLSLGMALALLILVLPPIELALQQSLFEMMVSPAFMLGCAFLIFIVAVLSAVYPAALAFNIRLDLNELTVSKRSKLTVLKSFVFVQILLSCVLTYLTLAIIQQMKFIEQLDKGFDSENLYFVELPRVHTNTSSLASEMAEVSTVQMFGMANTYPSYDESYSGSVKSEYSQNGQNLDWINMDGKAMQSLGLRLVAGRLFSAERLLDDAKFNLDAPIAVVLTESSLPILGYSSADQALDKVFKQTYAGNGQWREAKVIGVIKDIKPFSALRPASPTMFLMDSGKYKFAVVKLNQRITPKVYEELRKVYKKVFPNDAFNVVNMQQRLTDIFSDKTQQSTMTLFSAAVSIILTCVGMLALSTLLLNREVKTLVLCKILGASDMNLLQNILRQFLWPLVLGTLVSFPLSLWLYDKWLRNFAYQAPSSIWLLLVPFLVVAAILAIVGCRHYRNIRRLEPATVLHYE